MKKKLIIPLIAALLTLSACGDADTSGDTSEETTTTAAQTTEAETTTTAAETQAPETTTAETTTAAETTAEETVTSEAGFQTPEGLSPIYADLDNMSFILDGKLITLGSTTMQEMIDSGVEFKKMDDLDEMVHPYDGDNDVPKAMEFDSTGLMGLGFDFLNPTEHDITKRECVISSVHAMCDSRLPGADISTLGRVQFAFPFDVTKDMVIANSGLPNYMTDEPEKAFYVFDENDHKGGYRFFFNEDDNMTLCEIRMRWIPR